MCPWRYVLRQGDERAGHARPVYMQSSARDRCAGRSRGDDRVFSEGYEAAARKTRGT